MGSIVFNSLNAIRERRQSLTSFLKLWRLHDMSHIDTQIFAHGIKVYRLLLTTNQRLLPHDVDKLKADVLSSELDTSPSEECRIELALLDDTSQSSKDLLRLHKEQGQNSALVRSLDLRTGSDVAARKALLVHAAERNWKVKRMTLDVCGRYSIEGNDSAEALARYSGLA